MITRRFPATFAALSSLVLGACASGGSTAAPAAPSQPVRALPADAPPPSDGMPAGFAAAFTAADARARAIVFWQQCSANVLRLRAAGTFGKAATAPRNVYCERDADGLPLGGVFDVDTGYTRARRLTMVRLDGARPRHTGPIDTARVARAARLVRDITRDVTPEWRRSRRAFTVVPVLQGDGVVEGWVMPVSAQGARTAVQGGDVGIVRGADGRLQRVADRSATWKLVTLPATGPVTVASAERDVPAVSDLVIARSLGERGRLVTVTTAVARSTLVAGLDAASGSRFRWEHAPATPPSAPGTR